MEMTFGSFSMAVVTVGRCICGCAMLRVLGGMLDLLPNSATSIVVVLVGPDIPTVWYGLLNQPVSLFHQRNLNQAAASFSVYH